MTNCITFLAPYPDGVKTEWIVASVPGTCPRLRPPARRVLGRGGQAVSILSSNFVIYVDRGG